jgi:nitrogen fixation/metabolism regulation signal transduction histidine kinase
VKSAVLKRFLQTIGVLGGLIAVALWFLLLASTSASPGFQNHYPLILALNVLVCAVLLGLVGWQLIGLWRGVRQQVFGARLKWRLTLMFGLMTVLPGTLVYAVSVQFITRSIESWFDVRVEKALDSGLHLGRSALDSLLGDLSRKATVMARELADHPEVTARTLLARLREESGVQSAALFTTSGQLVASAEGALFRTLPPMPTAAELRRARAQPSSSVDGAPEHGDMTLRVLQPVVSRDVFAAPLVLQLIDPVPAALARNAEAVEEVRRDYSELELARQGLTRIYALTLTLTVLLALFAAFSLAFFLTRRLSAPLLMLAEATKAVAQGDFSPRAAFKSRDELGILTRSFSSMTRQLADAQAESERHKQQMEAARAYLESILANLSAGVMVFDAAFTLRTINEGAIAILGEGVEALICLAPAQWAQAEETFAELGSFIARHIAAETCEDGQWEGQQAVDLGGKTKTLLLRGSRLPQMGGGGHVVVFDDITELLRAQRSIAWGEVARRLAHEIKNPLTPIQLSAERLQMKLADCLPEKERGILEKSTTTIIHQVQAMKGMVDDFRDYSRTPQPKLGPLDLNALVEELLGLYEHSSAAIAARLMPGLPPVLGDHGQIRQVIHNLLRNAEEAQEGSATPGIEIATGQTGGMATLTIADRGAGFPPEILPRVFEPYVTTKARGTGLGLAIVKKIVSEHKGTINIENRAGGGAVVSITLPFLPPAASESKQDD